MVHLCVASRCKVSWRGLLIYADGDARSGLEDEGTSAPMDSTAG